MTIRTLLSEYRDWTGSLEDLAVCASTISASKEWPGEVSPDPITRHMLVHYRRRGLFSPAFGKKFGLVHLVQVLAVRLLLQKKWRLDRISAFISGKDCDALLEVLSGTGENAIHATPAPTVSGASETSANSNVQLTGAARVANAFQLLAIGVVSQFRFAAAGGIVSQADNFSSELHAAMTQLGAMRVRMGLKDHFGSIHHLLALCTRPPSDPAWGLPPWNVGEFAYKDVVLIDPDARVPTIDCVQLAQQAGSEPNLLEGIAYRELRTTCEQYGRKSNAVYTLLRRFIATHPVVTRNEIIEFERDNDLQLSHTFIESCYTPVLPHHLIEQQLYQCTKCQAPLSPAPLTGRAQCTTSQCGAFHEYVEKPLRTPQTSELRVIKPALLQYWVGPAIDEIAVFESARRAGLDPELYPDSDSCDIAMQGRQVGIDIKSHRSPIVLAQQLSRSLGGLMAFPTRIVAINDQSVLGVPDYLKMLRQYYNGPTNVEFMSVKQLQIRIQESA